MNWEIGNDIYIYIYTHAYIYTTLYKIDNMRTYCIPQGEEEEGIVYL